MEMTTITIENLDKLKRKKEIIALYRKSETESRIQAELKEYIMNILKTFNEYSKYIYYTKTKDGHYTHKEYFFSNSYDLLMKDEYWEAIGTRDIGSVKWNTDIQYESTEVYICISLYNAPQHQHHKIRKKFDIADFVKEKKICPFFRVKTIEVIDYEPIVKAMKEHTQEIEDFIRNAIERRIRGI